MKYSSGSFYPWVGVASLLLGTSPSGPSVMVVVEAFDQKIVQSFQKGNVALSSHGRPFLPHTSLDTRLFVENPRKEDRFQLKQAETTLSYRDECKFRSTCCQVGVVWCLVLSWKQEGTQLPQDVPVTTSSGSHDSCRHHTSHPRVGLCFGLFVFVRFLPLFHLPFICFLTPC